jgi:hypothetical protein
MEAALRQRVRARAGDRCEYCHLRQAHQPVCRLHVEHILPRQHGGGDAEQNLALACFHCNLHKGTNLTGIDPNSGGVVRLFHPRTDDWAEHFAWRGVELVGLTATGRTTIRVLRMNAPRRLELRASVLRWSQLD